MINSPVFNRALVLSFISLLIVIAAFSGYYFFKYYFSQRETEALLSEALIEFQQEVDQKGIDSIIEAYSDPNALWVEDQATHALEEDDLILRVIDNRGQTVVGYDGLSLQGKSGQIFIEHEFLDEHPATAVRAALNNQYEITIARFMPDYLYELAYELRDLVVKICLAILLTGTITAWGLTRLVAKRLAPIVSTASNIGEQGFDKRIPTKGTADEFDQTAIAVNDMLGRIDDLTRNMQHVSVGVAHDLKTPVSNIAGRLQLIERDIHNTSAIQQHVNTANEHIQSLRRTLDALLRLGEIEAGRRKSAFSNINLSVLVQDMAESYIPVFEDDDKQLRIDIADALYVVGDAELLVQALNNLLENIIEHARDGARAWIKLFGTAHTAYIEIGDDGPGISAVNSLHIFDRFVQIDNSRAASGNGLGLSLVKSIAELHGGGVKLANAEPGATFLIELPLLTE